MAKALYREYRPKKLSEVVGQEHITVTLTNAIKSNQLSHAYLFTGPRGVGKTSVARIMAHEVNNIDYKDDETHLDIIEIDAASNRRIDEIRSLRDKINIAPSRAKYKVYIIDEVHMLTREAFNALLKTLEEPPEHVIFILATTEANKVPDTIISRTQQFNFRPIAANQMIGQLKEIAKKEKINIEDAALLMIAQYGDGSFRDSLSLLDQIRISKTKISVHEVESILGLAPEKLIDSIVAILNSNDIQGLMSLLNETTESGYNIGAISKQLLLKIRAGLISGEYILSPQNSIKLIKSLIDVPNSNDPETLLEVLLLSTIVEGMETPVIELNLVEKPIEKPIAPKVAPIDPKSKPDEKLDGKKVDTFLRKNKPRVGKFTDKTWADILDDIRSKHNTLYGIARMATANNDNETLQLTVKFSFHARTLNESKNQKIISETFEKITGNKTRIVVVVDKKLELNPISEDKSKNNESLEAINDIFGDTEVLE